MGFAVARTPNEVALLTRKHVDHAAPPGDKMRLFAFYQCVKTVRLSVDDMAPNGKADSAILSGRD